MFDDINNNGLHQTPFQELQASIAGANVLSPFLATIIPQSFFYTTLSDVATVCVSEFVEGIPLEMYAFSIDSDLAVFHFVMAMLGSLDTLSQLQIIHRDINPENMAVHFDQQSKPSLVVFDFTWATSPGVQNAEPVPPFLNFVYRHPSGTHRNDYPSMGLIIRDMLSLYAAKVDMSWLSPLVETMLDKDDEHSPDTYQLGLQLLDLYVNKDVSALQAGSNDNEVQQVDSLFSYVERRRRELCQQPNIFAGKADFQRNVVSVTGTTRKVTVTGYQGFSIVNSPQEVSLIPHSTGLIRKDELLSNILQGTVSGLTVMDIGGNVGYFCARAVQFGASKATIVDMDSQYTTVATEMYQYLGSPFVGQIVVENKKLSELDGSSTRDTTTAASSSGTSLTIGDSNQKSPYAADVVIALALIHWSFNCSETSGSLARTIGNLAIRARKMLIIEWIDPSDSAIQNENHLGVGERDGGRAHNHFDSPYTLEEFLRVMRRIFHCVVDVGSVTPTRHIYIGRRKYGRYMTDNDGGNSNEKSDLYTRGDDWWGEHMENKGFCSIQQH